MKDFKINPDPFFKDKFKRLKPKQQTKLLAGLTAILLKYLPEKKGTN